MASSSGVSVRTVKSAIYRLRDVGLVRRVGSNKKGSWVLVSKSNDVDVP